MRRPLFPLHHIMCSGQIIAINLSMTFYIRLANDQDYMQRVHLCDMSAILFFCQEDGMLHLIGNSSYIM